MKKLIVFLASAALLTGYAQTSSQSGSGRNNAGRGSGSSSTSNSRTGGTGGRSSSSTSGGSGSSSSSGRSASTTSSTSPGATNRITFDEFFLRRATSDSLLEVVLGGIAETNSNNTNIQAFGAQLVTDHTAAIAQAQQVAATLGFTLPTALNTNQQQRVQRFSSLAGTTFDRAFIARMVMDHIQDIRLYEVAAVSAKNADVRAYARDQLPVLVNHLVTALEIRESLLSTPGTGATSSVASAGTSGTSGTTGTSANASGTSSGMSGGSSGGSSAGSGSSTGTSTASASGTDP